MKMLSKLAILSLSLISSTSTLSVGMQELMNDEVKQYYSESDKLIKKLGDSCFSNALRYKLTVFNISILGMFGFDYDDERDIFYWDKSKKLSKNVQSTLNYPINSNFKQLYDWNNRYVWNYMAPLEYWTYTEGVENMVDQDRLAREETTIGRVEARSQPFFDYCMSTSKK